MSLGADRVSVCVHTPPLKTSGAAPHRLHLQQPLAERARVRLRQQRWPASDGGGRECCWGAGLCGRGEPQCGETDEQTRPDSRLCCSSPCLAPRPTPPRASSTSSRFPAVVHTGASGGASIQPRRKVGRYACLLRVGPWRRGHATDSSQAEGCRQSVSVLLLLFLLRPVSWCRSMLSHLCWLFPDAASAFCRL